MITTTYGPMEENTLMKKVGVIDDDNEHTEWVEFYVGDELVHRSVHVTLKQGLNMPAVAANIGR